MIDVHVIDAAKMSFTEQITLIRKSNVLVGVHGAGTMTRLCLFRYHNNPSRFRYPEHFQFFLSSYIHIQLCYIGNYSDSLSITPLS